jgi:hypothetical protein
MSTVFTTLYVRVLRNDYYFRHPSRPRHPFSENKVAERGSRMTIRAFGMSCSLPPDGVIATLRQTTWPGPFRGHKKLPGLGLRG